MKKIKYLSLMLTIIFLLIGCSAHDVDPTMIGIYDQLRFDWNSMTFTETDQRDIFYGVGNSFDDLLILHHEVTNKSFTESEATAYSNLLSTLDELSTSSSVPIGVIMSYTSAELRDELNVYAIELTLDDIVTFNSLKTLIEEIKLTMNAAYFYLPKIDYIEKRLSIIVTEDNIYGFELLQEFNITLFSYGESIIIYELTFEDFLDELENIDIVPLEETILSLEDAHQLIVNLKNS